MCQRIFELEIHLDSDDMQHDSSLAAAVNHVADCLDLGETSGIVMDANGNTVGGWSVKREGCRTCGDECDPEVGICDNCHDRYR
jgi:hypothetical protein